MTWMGAMELREKVEELTAKVARLEAQLRAEVQHSAEIARLTEQEVLARLAPPETTEKRGGQ